MTVKELIEQLKQFGEDTEVIFADYEPVIAVHSIGGDDGNYIVITDRE